MAADATGYYIVPDDQLDIKHSKTDENNNVTIARCTCPDCSGNRRAEHKNEPCVRLDMSTGLGKCYNCGFKFIISSKVTKYRRSQPVKKYNWKLPTTTHLTPLDAVAIDFLIKRGIHRKRHPRQVSARPGTASGAWNITVWPSPTARATGW